MTSWPWVPVLSIRIVREAGHSAWTVLKFGMVFGVSWDLARTRKDPLHGRQRVKSVRVSSWLGSEYRGDIEEGLDNSIQEGLLDIGYSGLWVLVFVFAVPCCFSISKVWDLFGHGSRVLTCLRTVRPIVLDETEELASYSALVLRIFSWFLCEKEKSCQTKVEGGPGRLCSKTRGMMITTL